MKDKKKCCEKFDEKDRQQIFTEYWRCRNNFIQDTFIQSLVDVVQTSVSTVGEDQASRRKFSRIFHLKKEGKSLPVCKEMFISTLAISQQKVNGAINRNKENTGITLAVVKPRNPRPAKGFKWMDDDITFLDEFFEKVPKAPSHYCRRDTTKTYLSVIFPTLIKLYDVYKARCKAFKKTAFSLSKFSNVFKGKSLSLYK